MPGSLRHADKTKASDCIPDGFERARLPGAPSPAQEKRGL